jgi:hypothetical protein
MLRQQLTGDQTTMSGKLVITADSPALPELQSLAEELSLRMNIQTDGSIIIAPPPEQPPPPDLGAGQLPA